MKYASALLAPVMLLSGCAMTRASTTPDLVALGQSQRVGAMTVTPLEVVEDSRCPMTARCIWAGRVVVKVAITRGPYRLERRLTLGEPTRIDFGTIMLDSVMPARATADSTPPSETYRFHFDIPPG